jgi:acylphosphatase
MKEFKKIQVIGKVQGVFFRASTKEKADELGIVGTVRNQTDGSVWIEAGGDSEIMKSFIEWCYEGPRAAKVEKVIVKDAEPFQSSEFKVDR